MRLGLILERSNFFRVFGPVIEAAFERGWEVCCWYYESDSPSGVKDAYSPTNKDVPVFTNGSPEIEVFTHYDELPGLMAEVDCVISTFGRSRYTEKMAANQLPEKIPWVALQIGIDFFYRGLEHLLSADLNCLYSDYWLHWYIQERELFEINLSPEVLYEQLKYRCAVTGFTEMDAYREVDPKRARQQWNIPEDKKVVTYLPNSPCAHQKLSEWCWHIYSESNRVDQLKSVLKNPNLRKYLPHIFKGWNDVNIVKAVRRFCDQNDAYLIVKTRAKTIAHDYEREAADLLLYDESDYPPTILDALSISDLLIGYHSMAVTEAAFIGVPYLLIAIPNELIWQDPVLDTLESDDLSLWRCDDVIWRFNIDEVLRTLPELSIEDFQMDSEKQQQYVQKHLGFNDMHNANRILDEINSRIKPPEKVQD